MSFLTIKNFPLTLTRAKGRVWEIKSLKMKLYFVLFAMLCFGNISAQTTQLISTNTIDDSTISVEKAIVITKITHVKTVFLSKGVSEWDAMTYFVKQEAIVDDVRVLSLFHGAVKREKVLYQKGNKLFYFIREVPDNWEAVAFLLFVLTVITVGASTNEKGFPIVWIPTFVGLGTSVLMDICATKYHYTWD